MLQTTLASTSVAVATATGFASCQKGIVNDRNGLKTLAPHFGWLAENWPRQVTKFHPGIVDGKDGRLVATNHIFRRAR
uniref:Putative secreted peptide n=1 Tax=Anopheles braziliensis TaxID=58242 RepID=A0A2M3ZV26_9DIPT